MSSRTIADTLLELPEYKQLPGFHGTPLKFEFASREQVGQTKVDELYQRLISPTKLNSYGELDFCLLIPSIISRRPKELGDLAGDYTIDGQNKQVIYYNSGHQGDGISGGCPQMVLEHEYDDTKSFDENYKLILKIEAKLFQALNTLRKKLNRIDELRAEVVYGDELAVNIESVMKTLNLVSERFGSNKKDAREVKSFSQFYYTLTADYANFGGLSNVLSVEKIKSGYDLWSDIYGATPGGSKVHGTALRAICFLERFINEGLANGIQATFREWCVSELANQFNQEKLVKGFGSFDSPRWTLYRIIDKYNDWMTNKFSTGAPTIKEKRLVQAVSMSGEERFCHPDEEEWARIIDRASKDKS